MTKKPPFNPSLSGLIKATIGNASSSVSKQGDYLDITIKYDHVPKAKDVALTLARITKALARHKYTELRKIATSITYGELTLWININKPNQNDTNKQESTTLSGVRAD